MDTVYSLTLQTRATIDHVIYSVCLYLYIMSQKVRHQTIVHILSDIDRFQKVCRNVATAVSTKPPTRHVFRKDQIPLCRLPRDVRDKSATNP